MMTEEMKIAYEYVKKHPGTRLRYIPLTKLTTIQSLHELETIGMVYRVLHRDLANMEIYDKWYITT